jgi:hypothetical protein
MYVLPTIGDDVGDDLSLTEQIVFVHEYTHALQDQHFGLDVLEDEAVQTTPDRAIATLALVEGDATAAMQSYSQEVAMRNPAAVFELLAEGAMAGNLIVPSGIPDTLVRELIFPYEQGLSFVLALYDDGGWDRINEAYENLPETTEQIMHPEKYLAGEGAIPVETTDLALGEGYEEVWDIPLGEFYLAELLRTQLSSFEAGEAAAGWGGDNFQLYVNPETGDQVWTLQITWDAPEEAAEFAEAFAAFGETKFDRAAENSCWSNADEALCFVEDGGDSLIVSAPSLEIAQEALAAVQGQ